MRLKIVDYPQSGDFVAQIIVTADGKERVMSSFHNAFYRHSKRLTLERLKEDAEMYKEWAEQIGKQLEEMIAKLPE